MTYVKIMSNVKAVVSEETKKEGGGETAQNIREEGETTQNLGRRRERVKKKERDKIF